MKRLMVAFALISVSGCLCAKECDNTSKCPTGQVCGSHGLCEEAGGGTGGGTAGGQAGGSSGGVATGGGRAGGSAAGGSTGGGGSTAGGMAGGCSCPSHQYCTATGGCLDYELAWVQPAENSNFETDASVSIPVAVTVRYQDGGSLVDVQVPISGPNPSMTMVSGLGTPGALVIAGSQSGTVMLQAGWAGGVRLPRSVNLVGCENVTCPPYEQCVASTTGGSCQPLGLVINWVAPVTNLVRGPGVPLVPISMTVTSDAGPLPSMVPVVFDGGVIATANRMGLTSTYAAQDVDFTSLAQIDGTKLLTAGWPGFSMPATRSFRWDSVPPEFTIRIQSPPGRPTSWPNRALWRKDDTAEVEVGSNELLGSNPVLSLVGTDGGASLLTPNSNCGFSSSCASARCDCFSVDLAAAPLNGVTGSIGLTVSGQDAVLNPATQDGGSIVATRVKWQAAVPGLVSVVEPAMDTRGRLYIGGTDGGLGGVVAQILTDGTVQWTQSTYGAVTAPIVWSPSASLGDAGVFVATKTSAQAQMRALDAVSGTAVDPGLCVTALAGAQYSARMVSLGATVVTARESGGNQQEAYIANPASGNCTNNGTIFLTGRATLVGKGSGGGATEVFAGSTGIGGLFRLTTNTAGTAWVGSTDSFAAVSDPVGSLSLGGGRAFFTRAAANLNGVFSHNLSISMGTATPAFVSGSSVSWTGANLGQSLTAVDVFFGSPAGSTAGELHKTTFTFMSSSFAPNTQGLASRGAFSPTSNSFTPAHAPILGQGGLVYTVSTAGDLSVFSSSGTRLWVGPSGDTLFGSTTVAPVLDVARDSMGAPRCGRPGTLYVLTNTGTVTAFIVDSQGLDRNAAWPRFQHDNANSGNADTQLSSWGCQ